MRRRRQSLKKTFERQMLEVGLIPNLVAGLIVMIFVLLLTEIPRESLLSIIIFAFVITGSLQFIVAPITNKIIPDTNFNVFPNLFTLYHLIFTLILIFINYTLYKPNG